MSGPVVLKAGDRVAFLNEEGGGVVVRLIGRDRAVVNSHEGFELEFPVKELVPVDGSTHRQLDRLSDHDARMIASGDRRADRMAARDRGAIAPISGKEKERDKGSVMEVDLHLHEIIDSERGMSDGEKLDYQLRYFERMLNTAIREKKDRLVVIHGVGEGVLREEVRKLLGHFPGVRFEDADSRRYGFGATEVRILRH